LSKFGKIEGFACNVANRDQRLKIVEYIKQKYGKLDVLVPNAAVSTHFGPQFDITEKQYDKLWDVNVKSTFFLV
jgi:dehydrogenase/reductase SDR family member 4